MHRTLLRTALLCCYALATVVGQGWHLVPGSGHSGDCCSLGSAAVASVSVSTSCCCGKSHAPHGPSATAESAATESATADSAGGMAFNAGVPAAPAADCLICKLLSHGHWVAAPAALAEWQPLVTQCHIFVSEARESIALGSYLARGPPVARVA